MRERALGGEVYAVVHKDRQLEGKRAELGLAVFALLAQLGVAPGLAIRVGAQCDRRDRRCDELHAYAAGVEANPQLNDRVLIDLAVLPALVGVEDLGRGAAIL